MSTLADPIYAHLHAPQLPESQEAPLLGELPKLLEYRSEADPDAEFIPKTVGGFAAGALVMGVTLYLAEIRMQPITGDLLTAVTLRIAFMIGITAVATSLLLVGLKVRSDHSAVDLFTRHWLNSIGTGAAYALLMWGPWMLLQHEIAINRFVAVAIWMLPMSFPLVSAMWTIGPHPHYEETPGQ